MEAVRAGPQRRARGRPCNAASASEDGSKQRLYVRMLITERKSATSNRRCGLHIGPQSSARARCHKTSPGASLLAVQGQASNRRDGSTHSYSYVCTRRLWSEAAALALTRQVCKVPGNPSARPVTIGLGERAASEARDAPVEHICVALRPLLCCPVSCSRCASSNISIPFRPADDFWFP